MKISPMLLSGVAAAILTAVPLSVWLRRLSAPPWMHAPQSAAAAETPPSADLSPEAAAGWLDQLWAACEEIQSTEDPQAGRQISPEAVKLLDQLTAADCALILRQIETEEDDVVRAPLRRMLFGHYCCIAPQEALVFAEEFPAPVADALLPPLLAAWQQRSPEAAKWAEAMTARKEGEWKTIRAFLADADPVSRDPEIDAPVTLAEATAESKKLMAAQPPGTSSGNDIQPLLQWAAAHSAWASALEEVPPGTSATEHYRNTIHAEWAARDWRGWRAWMDSHPDEGVTEVEGSFYRDNLYDNAAAKFQARMAKNFSAEETAAFLTAWQDRWENPNRAHYLKPIYVNWLQQEPEAASGWLANQPSAPWRDRAAATLAEKVIGDDPEAAMVWVEAIADETHRNETRKRCWQQWNSLEPAVAEAWADAHHPELRQ